MKFLSVFLLCLLLSGAVFSDENVATVVLKKGNVKARLKDGQIVDVKLEQALPEGVTLLTSERSFVKLIFIDKSQMNLGPSSSMLIQAFPRKEAGIIKLIKGQIRSEVTKNYMEMSDKSKSKLYIQTRTASMGIRGTDFQVNYNPENQNSSLIVFEGKVAMAHIDRSRGDEVFNQEKLEALVSSNTAVLVKQGQISAVNLNISDRALIPTKLAPKQFEGLKENTTGLEGANNSGKENQKKYRDIVPPGGDSTTFLNVSPEALKAEKLQAQGFFNEKTHEYQPPAGAIIDLKTVNIIPPPNDAAFDHTTKTFAITDNYGKVDEKTGQYKAPTGYQLSNEGKFVPANAPRKDDPGTSVINNPATAAAPLPSKISGTAPAPTDASVPPPPPTAAPAPVTTAPQTNSTAVPPAPSTAVQPPPTTVQPPPVYTAPTVQPAPVPVSTTPTTIVQPAPTPINNVPTTQPNPISTPLPAPMPAPMPAPIPIPTPTPLPGTIIKK